MAAVFVNGSGQNEQSLERTFHRCFLPSFTSFGWGILEEKIKMWKVNGRQTTDDGRWTPSNGKSSHCLCELKTPMNHVYHIKFQTSFDQWASSVRQSNYNVCIGGQYCERIRVLVSNATFNNISVSSQSVLLVEETRRKQPFILMRFTIWRILLCLCPFDQVVSKKMLVYDANWWQ